MTLRGFRSCGVLLAFIVVAAPLPLRAAPGGTVSGVVRDPAGAGQPGATIQLSDATQNKVLRSTIADDTGRFTFTAVAPGSYSVTASLPDVRPSTVKVTVKDDGTAVADIVLGVFLLDEMVIAATRDPTKIADVPQAVTVVPKQEIQEARRALGMEETLKFVPGVRVKVLIDGIPKNNAGGSAQDLSNIDLESVDHIEVLRGPATVLYGNQSGGVINLITEEGPPTPFVEYRQLVGSYSLFREHLKGGGQTGNFTYYLAAQRTDQDGYRQNSGWNSTGFTSKFRYAIDDRSGITTVVAFDRNDEHTPGPLTQAAIDADPRQAEPTFLANGVRGVTEELRLGVIYQRQFFERSSLELIGYYVPRHLGPFQQIGVRIPQDFMNRGGSARFSFGEPIAGISNRVSAGVDYQDTPITTGTFNSITGVALANLEERATTFGAYLLEELSILPNLVLSGGGRWDWVKFSSEDLTKAAVSRNVNRRVYRKVTPRAGVTWRPVQQLNVYANYSRGFEAPVIGELRTLPGGAYGFNGALDPQTSDNFEVGSRGGTLDDRFSYEVALFRQNVHDLISPSGLFPNNSFENIGQVRQYGVEFGGQVRLLPGLSLIATYTFSDFTFQNFVSNGVDLSGKKLPGVPDHMFAAQLKYRHPAGLLLAVEAQAASPVYVDNANTTSTPRYTVFNARAAYDYTTGKVRLEPFLNFRNITDRKYSQFALINDAGRRYYNPLPPFSVYGGLRVGYVGL
jgi:iron complex outermembrane receptor protein